MPSYTESKLVTPHHYTHPFTIPPRKESKPDLPPKPGYGVFIPKLAVAPKPGYANRNNSTVISETPMIRIRNSMKRRKSSENQANSILKPDDKLVNKSSDTLDTSLNSKSEHILIQSREAQAKSSVQLKQNGTTVEPISKSKSLSSEQMTKPTDEDADEESFSTSDARKRNTYSQRMRSVDLTNNQPLEFPPIEKNQATKPPTFKLRTYKYPSGNEIGTSSFHEFNQTLDDLLRKHQGVTMKHNPANILLPK